MPDKFSIEKRREIMSHVKNKNTKPEIRVRSLLHRMGYRFRIGRKDLPGKPDIVLPKYKTAIFVHGCFWHGHVGCKRSSRPTTNVEFWNTKLDRNLARDRENARKLTEQGWRVFTIWECELKDVSTLKTKLAEIRNPSTG